MFTPAAGKSRTEKVLGNPVLSTGDRAPSSTACWLAGLAFNAGLGWWCRLAGQPAAEAADPASSRSFLGEASPRHLMELVSLIWKRKVVSPQACDEMLAILGRQHFLDQVPRFLDCGLPVAHGGPSEGIAVACKTGMVDGIRADVGLLALRGRAVSYAVMTAGCADTTMHHDHEGLLVNAGVGRILAEHFWPGPGHPPVRPTGRGLPRRVPCSQAQPAEPAGRTGVEPR